MLRLSLSVALPPPKLEGAEMNVVWSYVAMGLLTVAAAAVVAGGEPATAELKLVEAATAVAAAGVSAVSASLLAAPKITSSVSAKTSVD